MAAKSTYTKTQIAEIEKLGYRTLGDVTIYQDASHEGIELIKGKYTPFRLVDLDRIFDGIELSESMVQIIELLHGPEKKSDEKPKEQPEQKQMVPAKNPDEAILPTELTNALIKKHPGTIPILISLQHTAPQYIKEKPGRGTAKVKYVEGSYMKRALNYATLFDHDFEIIETREDDDEFTVLGKLTVRTTEGKTIVKTQFGCADKKFSKKDKKLIMIGDTLKAAATDAFKKCAAELGIAQKVYDGSV